ncbi:MULTISPECIES: ROK family protein [Thermomonospora]|uniref:ROK family protein n=1 Tax=Thermomonospora curvata (strain ATCC 19995 / DSM 43183 / JCM 3096 / KCTC 9072 / NBRC 15933 / NCIMB 10081 / Henssen B9) TaxID=471852 RepID=D1A7Q3_THECD|nr:MULTISPECIES: ROK family protein [Thermomonospora]ACY96642.1 ROK family protein [Thermomonospora curvata DSM 43183]PKK15442.1 MAG: ROK family protein [Thermomonospora sp. CIF 1]
MGQEHDAPVLAVDIGGTKLAAALVDPEGRITHYDRIATPADPDPRVLWRTLESLLDKLLAEAGCPQPAGVGVGCGGPMRWPSGEVSPLNIPAWRDFPLRRRLRARHPDLPVRVHNDAICVAVGEHWRGAGRGYDNVLGMVVSTGVGGGLVLGGRLIDGASGNAGHIGHVVVDPQGPPCECGGRGCLEAVARGPGLVAWAQRQGWRPGQAGVSGVELAEDARLGHPVAGAALQRAGRALGVAIASAMHLCDLEVVAIGGGLAQCGPLLFDPLQEALREHARMEFARRVQVVPAALGQTAGLVGAAALILAGDRYWNAD